MLDESLISGKTFQDVKNFPYGFSRSGNFSRNESELLMRGGVVATELLNGERVPDTEAQSHFLSVCRGELDASSEFERIWLKYVDLTGRKRFVFSFASTGNLASTSGSVSARDIFN